MAEKIVTTGKTIDPANKTIDPKVKANTILTPEKTTPGIVKPLNTAKTWSQNKTNWSQVWNKAKASPSDLKTDIKATIKK
jgi:hypothetical protein